MEFHHTQTSLRSFLNRAAHVVGQAAFECLWSAAHAHTITHSRWDFLRPVLMKVQHAAVSPTCTKYTTHARTHMCHTHTALLSRCFGGREPD